MGIYDNDKATNSNCEPESLVPALTASIAIVADRDRYKREREELIGLMERELPFARMEGRKSWVADVEFALSSLKP